MDTPTAELPPGVRLGSYTLAGEVGEGASAKVYRAHDDDGRVRAVKVRRRGNPQMDRRFLREFESMRLLRVPGVVLVHEAGIEGDWLWFSMDLVDGVPFDQALPTDLHDRVPRVVDLGRQLVEVLAALHEAGFVHRDIKPSNVLVDAAGGVHVLDFGIGRYFGEIEALSASGEVLGTIPYMAPEQVAGLPSDARGDVFSAGVMLWESIAGKRSRPLTPMAWVPRICLERLPPLACRFREVPLALSRLLDDLTAVDPIDRPSARAAAHALRKIAAGERGNEWPEPPWVDPGDWWHDLEGVIGDTSHAPVWILEGRTGSGRRRIAEQVHRQALIEGVWPLHVHCRLDRVGGVILDVLEVLTSFLDEETIAAVVADAADPIRQVWPQLPLPRRSETGGGSTGRITDAFAAVVRRLSERRPICLIVHDLEQVDPVSARTLPVVAAAAGPRLGMLLLVEPRWMTAAARQVIGQIRAVGAGHLEVPPLGETAATAIVNALCPAQPVRAPATASAQQVVEIGLASLAAWRNEPWFSVSPHLWPLAIRPGSVPTSVWRGLVGESAAPDAWAHIDDNRVELAGRTAWAIARARLSALRRAAGLLARAWEADRTADTGAADLASLWVLCGDAQRAFEPGAKAALEADRRGHYAEARRWMLLLDTMPRLLPQDSPLLFELAVLAANAALRSDTQVARQDLLTTAEGLARGPDQEGRARILRAEWQLRGGNPRAALVSALRVASTASVGPQVAAHALLVAVQARVITAQIPDARRELERAKQLLGEQPDPVLGVAATNLEADLAFHTHDLLACKAMCQQIIRDAAAAGLVRGVASASSRLGQVLRQLGKRREAEHNTRSAREAFATTGDAQLDAETGLALATLQVERGDTLGAHHLLDEAIRRIRALNFSHLLPAAWRVALQISTMRADPSEAAAALDAIATAPLDPEAPAALVRWWRSRGDTERALATESPPRETWGYVSWRIERARAMLAGGDEQAAKEARGAMVAANRLGFAELEVYAGLLQGPTEDSADADWSDRMRKASSSAWTEVVLGALEMDARRLEIRGDLAGARARWITLAARAEELGHRPSAEEAAGWLLATDGPRS